MDLSNDNAREALAVLGLRRRNTSRRHSKEDARKYMIVCHVRVASLSRENFAGTPRNCTKIVHRGQFRLLLSPIPADS